MPGMTGVQLLQQARSSDPRPRACCSRHTPTSTPSSMQSIKDTSSVTSPSHGSRRAGIRDPSGRRAPRHDRREKPAPGRAPTANAKLTEANRLKGVFLEVASHELNTPVTVVLGLTDLWKLSLPDDATGPERQWVERINAAAQPPGEDRPAHVQARSKTRNSGRPSISKPSNSSPLSEARPSRRSIPRTCEARMGSSVWR